MNNRADNTWPSLPLEEWRDTKETLHRWMQIVGKIRLALTPLINHWWNVPFYVSARGLTTADMAYGDRTLDMEFDFISHVLRIRTSDHSVHELPLAPRSVADFYKETFSVLKSLHIDCPIWTTPVEIPSDVIPLDRDRTHHHYDREYAERFWRILRLSHQVFTEFRARFIGKCSPVHFFWGGFDMAVTRFSGRRAPPREGADAMTREGYSHEVSSVGFWPGDERLAQPTFYSYAAPEPAGFRDAPVSPPATYYNAALGGFYLHYDDLRQEEDPAATLMQYCQSTYEAAANLGAWDRAALERQEGAR